MKSKAVTGLVLTLFLMGLLTSAFNIQPSLAQGNIFFYDHFDGEVVDLNKWDVSSNGYPEPAVWVEDSFINLGRVGVSSLDFPYVSCRINPFPVSDDFELGIAMQYIGVGGGYGNGFVVLSEDNRLAFDIWQDSVRPLLIVVGTSPERVYAYQSPTTDLTFHVFRFIFSEKDSSVTVFKDEIDLGTFKGVPRPAKIWFGHPTVGQLGMILPWVLPSLPPAEGNVDENGIVIRGREVPLPWASFKVDSVKVEMVHPVVGGNIVLINKLGLLTPHINSALAVILAMAVTVAFLRYRKKQ